MSPRLRPAFAAGLAAGLAAVAFVPAPRPAAAQPPAALPPDLALVHPDALGFAHVRAAELWANPVVKEFRTAFEKAGPKALAALDEQFLPKPSTVDRVTAVVLPPGKTDPAPRFVVIVRFTAAFDRAAVAKAYAPSGKPVKAGTREVVADPDNDIAVFTPDDRTLVLGEAAGLAEYLTWAPKPDGGLAPALAAAAAKPVTAAVNVARLPLPPGLADGLPDDFRPLARAGLVTVSVGLDKDVTVDARVTFPTPADAADGEKAARKALAMARAALKAPRDEAERVLFGKADKAPRPLADLPEAAAAVAALGALATADEILADPPLKRDGAVVAATVTLPPWTGLYVGGSAVAAGLAIPAVQKARESASLAVSMNNLKQLALAMHVYHDAHGTFPPAAITDKAGKPLLSWRVAVLPYVEQQALYQQFKLDEPWDSEHNLKLARIIPKVYVDPRDGGKAAKDGKTFYKAFVGKDALLLPAAGRKIQTITDGTSNTAMIAAGGDPVVWTKPDDFAFDPEKPAPDLTRPFPKVLAAFADGSVRVLPPTVFANKGAILKALITPSGGEVVNYD